MPDLNATIAAIGGGLVAVSTVYTAITGFRSKGKDQHLSRETTSYDQVQEDLRESRAECARLRTELREWEDRCDTVHAKWLKRQAMCHDLYSIFRVAFGRMLEKDVPYKDLAERVGEIQHEAP